MLIFRVFLLLVWTAVLVATLRAANVQGLEAGGDLFIADLLSDTWHGQFAIDFSGHLLLMALWVAWRQQFSLHGLTFGLLCILGGALFSAPYLLVLTLLTRGDMSRLLLGKHARLPEATN